MTTPGEAAVHAPPVGQTPAQTLEPLLDRLVEQLAEALAPRIAAALAKRHDQPHTGPPSRRLLTLDELVTLLPAGKKPATWKAWLYQRSRLGQVPGCHKLGGRLFFDPELTLPWLLNGATNRQPASGLDLPAEQSLHAPSMADNLGQKPSRGGRG